MKKGKGLIAFAGVLDILFSLGLFAVIALYFANVDFVSGLFLSFWSVCSMFITLTLDLLELLNYALIGFIGLVGLFSLIFGSVSIARTKKEPKSFYNKGGRLIVFAILETIVLALFVFFLIKYYSLISVIVVSLLGAIVFFRYIGIFVFFSGKRKYTRETPVA